MADNVGYDQQFTSKSVHDVRYPHFGAAVEALDNGDLDALRKLIADHPSLITTQGLRNPGTPPYFRRATLLHHVAGNPIRCPIPPNAVDLAQLLIDKGADVNAVTDDGSTAFGLVITSKQASDADLSRPLMQTLLDAGATVDIANPDHVARALLNCAPAAAAALLDMGAAPDLRWSAGLGRVGEMEALRSIADNLDWLEEALLFAAVRNMRDAAEMLVDWGARGDVMLAPLGIPARTTLHEAANRGHFEIVKRMAASGADRTVADAQWHGTPAHWAEHGGHVEIAAWLRGETV